MSEPVDCWRLSAVELQQRYREGSLTPILVARTCLARIAAVQPRLNAFVALRGDALMEDAHASSARHAAGSPLSPLDGIPLSVKDNLLTRDLPTTWGSMALREYRPEHDELPVARARAAGALLVGKTNVPEFTCEGYTSNRLFGTTRNPWDPRLTPGGSSGGAAASVAAGCTPLALGTDAGGSIRRPASHTGLVGFKPSIGAVPREHMLPPTMLDFDVVGTLARTVADARLLFEAIRAPLLTDRSSRAQQQAAGAAAPRRAFLRVLYVPHIEHSPVDPEIAMACEHAALRLRGIGHEVDIGALPLALGALGEAWAAVVRVGLAWMFECHPSWREAAGPQYLALADEGARVGAARLWQVLALVDQFRRECDQLFQRLDVIVTPAAAALPWPADEVFPPRIAGQAVGPRGHAVFTGWVNAAGLPAVALPAGVSTRGLPIGMQMIGAYGSDDALLALAARFERLAPWAGRWPPL